MRRRFLAMCFLFAITFLAGCAQGTPSADAHTELSEGSSVIVESQPNIPLGQEALTPEEVSQLSAAKESFEAMTSEEQARARSQEQVWCPNFDHLDWETRIDSSLIRYVGEGEFNAWVDGRWDKGLCTSIYDLARDFSIPYEKMEELIKENGLEELYPLDRVAARFDAFGLTPD